MASEEKPWILDTGSFKLPLTQIDQEERDNLIKDIEDGKSAVILKDGSYVSINKSIRIMANPHYVSPEEIEKGRKVRALRWEFEDLKKQGIVTTLDEYKEWKKKSVAQNKKLEEYLYDGAEPENEPIF